MAYSTQRVISDGSLVLLSVSIEYLERESIHVLFDNVEDALPWAWVGETNNISFTPAVPNGVEVLITRLTKLDAPYNVFSQGAQFTAESLDEDIQQILHIAQEATEGSLGGDFFQEVDMHGYKIKNLGTAVDALDAVPLTQVEDIVAPYVTSANAAATTASDAAAAALVSATNAAQSALDAAGYVVPTQTGNTGKFLSTDGSMTSWQYPYPDTAGHDGDVLKVASGLPEWASAFPSLVGNEGKLLGVVSGAVQWVQPAQQVHTGTIHAFAGSVVPSDSYDCDGSAKSRTTDAALFAVIGTTYGAGDGSTTFNLPDLRGEFIRGLDLGRGVDAGRTLGSAQSSQNLAHGHNVNDPGHAHNTQFNVGPDGPTFDPGIIDTMVGSNSGPVYRDTSLNGTNISIQSSGGAEARPRNVALRYIIRR